MSITFRDYVLQCVQMLKDDPNLGDAIVVYSHDDEGNEFQHVISMPTPGFFDGDFYGEFYSSDDFDYVKGKDLEPKINCVCIN